jgi:hypothetical protein
MDQPTTTSPSTSETTAGTTVRRTSTTYEVRVSGHLDDHWATWLSDLTLIRHDDGTTVLTGSLSDQAQLHGLLARIRDLGVPLLSLSRLDHPAPAGSGSGPTGSGGS